MPPLITAERVSKRFGPRTVIDGLSFTVAEGEIVGMLGPNGSGKTTTVRLLNGVLRADRGKLRIAGLDPIEDGDAVRQMSGVLTESADCYRHLSGLQNLRFFAELYAVDDPDRPERLLATFGLADAKDRKVGAYSTGMRKRLGLAKALLHRPKILFLDEPTSGLDPDGIRSVLQAMQRINREEGVTILVCSHLLQQLEGLCHRYLFIDRGRLIEEGTLAELKEKYCPEILLEVETDLDVTSWTDAWAVVASDAGRTRFRLASRAQVPELLRRLTQQARVYGARVIEPDLEQLYFKVREGLDA